VTTTSPDQSSIPILDVPPTPRPPRYVFLRITLSLLLLAIVFWFVGKQLKQNFREIPWSEVHIQPAIVALTMAALILGRVMNGLNCRFLLAAMGFAIPVRRVLPIVWVASIGRYIPGKVAVVGGALVMLVRAGVRLPAAMAALFLSTALMMLTGLMAAIPLLFMPVMRQRWPAGPTVALVALCIGVVCLLPPVFLRLCNCVMRILKRPPLPDRMHMGPFAGSLAMTVGRIVLQGVALWLATRSFMPIAASQIPYMIAVAALASTIGFLAIFAPAGLGVHEGIYLITLKSLLGPHVGLLVVLFRLFQLVADIIMAGLGVALRDRAQAPAPPSC